MKLQTIISGNLIQVKTTSCMFFVRFNWAGRLVFAWDLRTGEDAKIADAIVVVCHAG
jgi:hypothetical protein